MSTPSALVQKLWNYCNILRDDGHGERQKLEKPVISASSAVKCHD